ncbi:MAG: hypothetical protein BME94_01775 [Methanobacteriales archaeon Met13]
MLTSVVMLIILAGMVGLAEERSKTAEITREAAEARIIAEKIAQSLEEVYAGGKGHSILVEMPPTIAGADYLIKVNSSGVFVEMKNHKGFSKCSAPRITGPLHTEDQLKLLPNRTYHMTHQRDANGNRFLVIKLVT